MSVFFFCDSSLLAFFLENREAATKAGFNVLRIISEPSATLLAYGVGQKDVSECWQVLSSIDKSLR